MMTTLLLATLIGASATASPTEVVKEGNAQVQKILASTDPSAQKLAGAADEFVDFGELAKRALGKEWEKLNAKQKGEFSDTMKGLLRASYAQKAMGQGTAQTKYGKETLTGAEAEVPTTLVVQKDEFPVVYKLFKSNGKGWRIYDVITDDVSLVNTYRDQFRKLLADKGFEGLLTTLKAKRAQLEKSSAEKQATGG